MSESDSSVSESLLALSIFLRFGVGPESKEASSIRPDEDELDEEDELSDEDELDEEDELDKGGLDEDELDKDGLDEDKLGCLGVESSD